MKFPLQQIICKYIISLSFWIAGCGLSKAMLDMLNRMNREIWNPKQFAANFKIIDVGVIAKTGHSWSWLLYFIQNFCTWKFGFGNCNFRTKNYCYSKGVSRKRNMRFNYNTDQNLFNFHNSDQNSSLHDYRVRISLMQFSTLQAIYIYNYYSIQWNYKIEELFRCNLPVSRTVFHHVRFVTITTNHLMTHASCA